MRQNNECCDDNYNGRIVIPIVEGIDGESSLPQFDIVGKSPIKVTKSMRGTTTVYEISLYVPTPPTVNMSVSPSFVEFGKPFSAIFTTSYSKGSEDIKTRVLSPDENVDTSMSPFTFTVSDTPTQVGSRYGHTFTVTDMENKTASASASIEVYYRYYRGLLPRNVVLTSTNAASFTSAIGSSISSVFGSKRNYLNDGVGDAHFCWLKPVGSPEMGTPVGDGNFPFETIKEDYTTTLNGIDYEIIKTVNFYPVATSVDLSF